jgi:agmatinase
VTDTSLSHSAPAPDPTMWSTLLHAGLAGSFMRVPHVPANLDALKQAGAQAAIYGMPWDSTSISRTGANYGPRGMRDISCQFLPYNADLDFDLLANVTLVDCGDCDVILANAERTFAHAERDIGAILDAGAIPVTLGGDHSISIPAVRAVAKRHPNPGLVLLDTHLDTAADVAGEELNHCCPISRAVDAGFPPEHIVLIGINGWQNPRSELEYCRERGIKVIWLRDIWRRGTEAVAAEALAIAAEGTDGIYLSVDIDALDSAFAPATCTPTPVGMTPREMLELVQAVGRGGLVGFDVVEVAPSLEASCVTSKMGVRVVLDALAFNAGARYPDE